MPAAAVRRSRSLERSSAVPLAWAWAVLIVYASLFPFEGWRWPPGAAIVDLLRLNWPHYFIPFDISSNLLGYAPFGLLVCLARLRHGATLLKAMSTALLLGAGLSYAMELTQHLLPRRVPSLLDWVLNTGGVVLGLLVAVLVQAMGWLNRWQVMRDRWIERGNGGALALLLLWPVALLFPTPVPLGVGQVGEVLRSGLAAALAGVPWADPVAAWLAVVVPPKTPLSPPAEMLAVMLGLLAPCLLAFAAARPGLRRLVVAAFVLGVAVAGTALSTALNFGPDHALAWRTPSTLIALGLALLLALSAMWLNPRLAGALALVVLAGLVVLVHQAPTDPYFAQSLQAWEQGRFVRFHGVAQWVGRLWPYAAMLWLLGRVGAR